MTNYTDQNYKRNTFVFAPIFHELTSKIIAYGWIISVKEMCSLTQI